MYCKYVLSLWDGGISLDYSYNITTAQSGERAATNIYNHYIYGIEPSIRTF